MTLTAAVSNGTFSVAVDGQKLNIANAEVGASESGVLMTNSGGARTSPGRWKLTSMALGFSMISTWLAN